VWDNICRAGVDKQVVVDGSDEGRSRFKNYSKAGFPRAVCASVGFMRVQYRQHRRILSPAIEKVPEALFIKDETVGAGNA
jgi:hypothetical protein